MNEKYECDKYAGDLGDKNGPFFQNTPEDPEFKRPRHLKIVLLSIKFNNVHLV